MSEAPDLALGRFVQVEDDRGCSMRFAEWTQRVDGSWVLRLTLGDQAAYDAVSVELVSDHLGWEWIKHLADTALGNAGKLQQILVGLALSEHMGDVNDYLPLLAERLGLDKPVWSDEFDRFVFSWEEEE